MKATGIVRRIDDLGRLEGHYGSAKGIRWKYLPTAKGKLS